MSGFRQALLLADVELHLRKAAGIMAALTILAEAAVVDVIATMAGNALSRQLARIAGPRMACRADQTLVLAGQGKAGLCVMIESPDLPVDRVMAILAVGWRAQRSLVVLVLMTG